MHPRHRLALLLAPLALPLAAGAQIGAYLTRPIRMVVPFAPGGPTDAIARLAAEGMGRQLGQSVVVENRPGAGGRIGLELIASMPNDGYNIGFVAGTLPSLQAFSKDWKRDVVTSFTYIGSVAESSPVVWASANAPGKTLQEVLTYFKANPGKMNIAWTAPGPHELLITHLNNKWGLNATRVAYKGEGEAKVAMLAGDVHMLVGSLSAHLPDYRAGKLKLLAVTSPTRLAVVPEVPTLLETGVSDHDISEIAPYGVIGPANLPADITAKLTRALMEGVKDPELLGRLRNFGGVLANSRPGDDFRNVVRRQTETINKLAREFRIEPQ